MHVPNNHMDQVVNVIVDSIVNEQFASFKTIVVDNGFEGFFTGKQLKQLDEHTLSVDHAMQDGDEEESMWTVWSNGTPLYDVSDDELTGQIEEEVRNFLKNI